MSYIRGQPSAFQVCRSEQSYIALLHDDTEATYDACQ